MEEIQGTKREALKVDYSALEGDFGSGESAPIIEEKTDTKVEEKDPNEIVDNIPSEEKKEDTATKTEGEVKTDEKVDVKEDAKPEEPVIELKVDDVAGYKEPAEEGSWKAVGELLEVDVAEESPEALKAALEAKYKPLIEEARKYSLESEYAKLKPETVAALKLIELGYPEKQAFNPTAEHVELLKLDDAALVRKNLEGLDGWDEERINLEMESLSENPAKLKHEALKLKEFINEDAQRIIAERDALLNTHKQNTEKIALQQKEQELAQLKEAVMSVDSFLGAKIAPEAKSAILQKHSRGDYGNILNDGKSLAEYLYFKEFGHKILEETRKSSFAKGKEEYAKQMLHIPPKQGEVSNVVKEKIAGNNQQNEGVKAIMQDFG